MIEAHPEIQLILTDVSMAEMDGRTLAHEAQARRPGLKVLLMSGHDPGLGSEVDLPLLPKPYSTTELASAVAKALGNG